MDLLPLQLSEREGRGGEGRDSGLLAESQRRAVL